MNGRSQILSGALALGLALVVRQESAESAEPPDPAPVDPAQAFAQAAAAEVEISPLVALELELESALDRIARLEADLVAERAAHAAELRELARRHEAELATLDDRIAFETDPGEANDPWDEIRRLRVELARERDQRIERERDWLGWSRALTAIAPDNLSVPEFDALVPFVPQDPYGPEPAPPEPPSAREEEVVRSLRTLLAVEEVEGLDLLEAGRLADGAIGPVLFRLVDVRGRLAGSLFAERLRLEGSRVGRSLTIVLEDGYEAHGGVRVPFDLAADEPVGLREQGGERRITLPRVDPMPWIEALPELFGQAELGLGVDDGLWDVERVRRALNALLAEDAAHGYPRFKQIGGVRGGVLRDVHIESLDAEGRVHRRLFADRVTLRDAWRGVEILCEDGVHVHGDKKAAFLDGRYRIFLPRADEERWTRERLPGLVPETSADFFLPSDDG